MFFYWNIVFFYTSSMINLKEIILYILRKKMIIIYIFFSCVYYTDMSSFILKTILSRVTSLGKSDSHKAWFYFWTLYSPLILLGFFKYSRKFCVWMEVLKQSNIYIECIYWVHPNNVSNVYIVYNLMYILI